MHISRFTGPKTQIVKDSKHLLRILRALKVHEAEAQTLARRPRGHLAAQDLAVHRERLQQRAVVDGRVQVLHKQVPQPRAPQRRVRLREHEPNLAVLDLLEVELVQRAPGVLQRVVGDLGVALLLVRAAAQVDAGDRAGLAEELVELCFGYRGF